MKINTETANRIKVIAIKLFVVAAYLLQSLVGKLSGILVFSFLLYFSAPYIGLVQPYSAHELILWVHELPENYKTTAFSSILTIVGFLIAFSVGATQQRQQFISQMKIEVASDIEVFFNEVVTCHGRWFSVLIDHLAYVLVYLVLVALESEVPLDISNFPMSMRFHTYLTP